MGILSRLKRFFGLEEVTYISPQPAGAPTTTPGLTVVRSGTTTAPKEELPAEPRNAANVFVPAEFLENLPKMSASQLDALDFGCVKVSDDGKVLLYNRWESEFAGVPQKDAIGRNFFRELAPCTNNRLVFGKFKEGVAEGELDTVLSYAFTYKMRPTLVKVHLYRHPRTLTNWVLVKRVGGGK